MLEKIIGLLSALPNEEWKRAHRRQTERLIHIPGHCNRRIMMNLSLPPPRELDVDTGRLPRHAMANLPPSHRPVRALCVWHTHRLPEIWTKVITEPCAI